jgi:hypothetical protein
MGVMESGLTRMSMSREERIVIPKAMRTADPMMAYCWSVRRVPIMFVAVLMSSIWGRFGGISRSGAESMVIWKLS